MWISYMCLTELTILRVRSRSPPTWIQNSPKQAYSGKTVNEPDLLLIYTNPADDEKWWQPLRWLASPRLVSRSRSFPPNCNRAKKQRLLQSSMFVSSITSWDYGYLFFILLMTYRNFKAKTEDILPTKNSYFHINLIEVEQRRNTIIFFVLIFKLAFMVGTIPV